MAADHVIITIRKDHSTFNMNFDMIRTIVLRTSLDSLGLLEPHVPDILQWFMTGSAGLFGVSHTNYDVGPARRVETNFFRNWPDEFWINFVMKGRTSLLVKLLSSTGKYVCKK